MLNSVEEITSDAALLEAVRTGDAGAYGMLFQRHAESARQVAFRWLSSSSERHELVAEAFARVLAAIRSGVGPRENLRPYVLVTMRHLAIKWRRCQERVDPYGEVPEVGWVLDDIRVVQVDEIVLRWCNADLVWSAFHRLPPRWREVLWYTEVESASPAELAPLLGITPNGVAALAMRARECLRQAYLQVQIPDARDLRCQGARQQMGMWIRGSLSHQRAQPIVDTSLTVQTAR